MTSEASAWILYPYSVSHLWKILNLLKSLPPGTNSSTDSLTESWILTVSLLLIWRPRSMCLLTHRAAHRLDTADKPSGLMHCPGYQHFQTIAYWSGHRTAGTVGHKQIIRKLQGRTNTVWLKHLRWKSMVWRNSLLESHRSVTHWPVFWIFHWSLRSIKTEYSIIYDNITSQFYSLWARFLLIYSRIFIKSCIYIHISKTE